MSLESLNPTGSIQVYVGDGANLDPFSRFRVSEPVTNFEDKHIHSINDDVWDYWTAGVAPAASHLPNESSTLLALTTALGDASYKQSRRPIVYSPGKGQLITATGVFGVSQTGVRKRVGYFNERDGVFFEDSGGTLSWVVRSFVTGVAVDTVVNQSSWSIDKLDGTGESGITLDVSKAQIFVIDLQWLGVGRVRCGFDIDGQIVYCHEFLNANTTLSSVYMSTGSLHVRYEIENIGTPVSAPSMKTVCASVSSEGGFRQAGYTFSAATPYGAAATIVGTILVPIMALRPKAIHGGKTNRRIIRLVDWSTFTSGSHALFVLYHVEKISAWGAETWQNHGADSGAEFSTNITVPPTAVESHPLQYIPVSAGKKGKSGGGVNSGVVEVEDRHHSISLNYAGTQDEAYILYAQADTATANVWGTIRWSEQE